MFLPCHASVFPQQEKKGKLFIYWQGHEVWSNFLPTSVIFYSYCVSDVHRKHCICYRSQFCYIVAQLSDCCANFFALAPVSLVSSVLYSMYDVRPHVALSR